MKITGITADQLSTPRSVNHILKFKDKKIAEELD